MTWSRLSETQSRVLECFRHYLVDNGFMIKIQGSFHATKGKGGSTVKASGMVATRTQKMDEGTYLPPLHLQNLAPCMSAQLGFFFFLFFFTTSPCTQLRELTQASPRCMCFQFSEPDSCGERISSSLADIIVSVHLRLASSMLSSQFSPSRDIYIHFCILFEYLNEGRTKFLSEL